MGAIRHQDPALLVIAAFSRHLSALEKARQKCEVRFGPIGLISESFNFIQTMYYAESMGEDLRKQFFVFQTLIPPDSLASIKLETNRWEDEVAESREYPEPRPLNLDPGYLVL